MRLLVAGDRNWADRRTLWDALDAIHDATPITLLIEGCARGADQLAGAHGPRSLGAVGGAVGWAYAWEIPGEHHPAEWARYGRAAGPIRNQEMLDDRPDRVVAFHPDIARSRGTRDMVNRAIRAGVRVDLVDATGAMTQLTEEVP